MVGGPQPRAQHRPGPSTAQGLVQPRLKPQLAAGRNRPCLRKQTIGACICSDACLCDLQQALVPSEPDPVSVK